MYEYCCDKERMKDAKKQWIIEGYHHYEPDSR